MNSQNLPDGCLDTFRQIGVKVSNAYRSKHSSQPLSLNSTLEQAALVIKIKAFFFF